MGCTLEPPVTSRLHGCLTTCHTVTGSERLSLGPRKRGEDDVALDTRRRNGPFGTP